MKELHELIAKRERDNKGSFCNANINYKSYKERESVLQTITSIVALLSSKLKDLPGLINLIDI